MKSVSLKSLLSVAILFCSTAVMAQPRQQQPSNDRERPRCEMADPADAAQKRTDRMAKELGLDASQKASLYDLNLKSAEEAKAAQESRKEAQQQAAKERKERQAKCDEYVESIMALLTDKQLIIYAEMLSNKADGEEGRGEKGERGERDERGERGDVAQNRAPQKDAPQRGEKGAPQRGNREESDPTQMADKMTERMNEKLSLSSSQMKKIATINLAHAQSMNDEMEVRHLEQKAREQDRKDIEAKREQYNLDVMALLNKEQKVLYVKMLSRMESHEPKGGQGGKGGKGGKEGRGGREGAQQRPTPSAI